MMDNFSYAYQSNKNRLASITNSVTSQTYNYGYDNNGNVTSDQYRDISGINYNISNLPEQLTANGSIVKYWYDNNGNRFRKQSAAGGEATDEIYILGKDGETEAVFNPDGTMFFNIIAGNETIGRFAPTPVDLYLSNTTLNGTYEAQNSITVEDNVTVTGTATLKAGNNIHLKPNFHAPSGSSFTAKIQAVPNTPKRFYYLKDHLGSIRVVVNEAGNIVSSDDYDPWGMILDGRSTDGSYLNAKYKFTSKELDTETQYYHFTWRPYDGRIGRWMQTDPLAKKYPGWSSYNYGLNNPLKFFDFKGMQPESGNGVKPKENWWDRFTRLFSFSLKTHTPEPESGNLQSSEINMLKGLSQTMESGQRNTEKKVQSIMNETYSAVYGQGPGVLNEASLKFSLTGITLGGGFLAAGQPEIGVPIITTSSMISLGLDATATTLTLIDYSVNRGQNRLNALTYQTENLIIGGAFGKAIEKLTSEVKIFVPIYNQLTTF
jgi:RHS repeat-associated protein